MTASAKVPDSSVIRTQRPFTYYDYALDTGLLNKPLDVVGTFFYVDQSSTGVATVNFNVESGYDPGAPVQVGPGTQIAGQFKGFILNAGAQPGKTLRIIVGMDATIKPGAAVSVGIQVPPAVGILDTPGVASQLISASASSLLAGTTVDTIFTPAQNPNGIILRGTQVLFAAGAAGQGNCVLLASKNVPVGSGSQINTIELAIAQVSVNAGSTSFQNNNMARRIPPAWGVYFITGVSGATALISSHNDTWEVL